VRKVAQYIVIRRTQIHTERKREMMLGKYGASVMVLLVMVCMVCTPVHGQDDRRRNNGGGIISTLDVDGSGSVSVDPEFVRISVGVQTQADTASGALQANNVLVTNVSAAITDLGVKDDDVTTSAINLSPISFFNSTTGESSITGFRASNTLQVDVYPGTDDEASLEDVAGQVLTTLVEEGINTINSVTFRAENTTDATDRARELAVRDARNTADVFAKAAGYVVSGVRSIDVNDFNSPAPVSYDAARQENVALGAPPMSTPISAGDITVSSSVSITYEIEPNFAP